LRQTSAFTLNFEPGALNQPNVLNGAQRLNGLN
jgi:hypothetical protein